MVIKINYTSSDVYVSTSVSPVYVVVNYSGTSGGGGNFVPYTGATADVDLGEFALSAGQVTLDTTPTGTASVATTRWNDTIGSSETTLKGGNVILKNGVDLVARVVNKVTPNATLTKAAYQAVRISGAQGQRLAVALAQANNDANSADTIGLVTETIATNQEGFIMTVGNLEGINTTGSLQGETWADGDVLYLSPTTAGALTNIKPTGATGHIVVVGYVEYAHVNNGKIYVKVMNGWELDELHNVYITSPTNNQVLTYESATSLWKNKTVSADNIYTANGTLTGNRTVTQAGYNLNFTGGAVSVDSGGGAYVTGFYVANSASITGDIYIGGGGSLIAQGGLFLIGAGDTTFRKGSENRGRIFSASGNWLIQTGGTFTDAGYKLDVNGTARVSSNLSFSGGSYVAGSIYYSASLGLVIAGNTGSGSDLTLTDRNGSERIKIITGGFVTLTATTINGVEIGSSSLSANITNSSQYGIQIWGRTSTTSNYAIQMYADGGSNGVFIGNNGNLVIGALSTTNVSTAILQANSTTKGFLPPRMTTAERDAIATPATGLQIYNTTTNENNTYNGTAWVAAGGGSTSPAGSNTQIQYNNSGAFGASANLVWDNANSILNLSASTSGSQPTLDIRQTLNTAATWMSIRNTNVYGTGTVAADLGIVGGSNQFFNGTAQGDIAFKAYSQANTSKFFLGATSGSTANLTLFTTGNIGVNTNTDAGYKLDVNGTARVSALTINTSGQGRNFTTYYGAGTDGNNIFIGGGGGSSQGSSFQGSYNSSLGVDSLLNNTNGANNTAIGYNSLKANTNGLQNTAVGGFSLITNTGGSNNSAFGVYSLRYNTTGGNNTGIGYNSMAANTTGGENTAVGYQSLQANTTAQNNSAFGASSLAATTTGSFNSAFGHYSLTANTSGVYNSAFGLSAMASNSGGSYNVAVGVSALSSNTNSYNTAIGFQAIRRNTTGEYNVAIGSDAGHFITGGSTINSITNNSIFIGGLTKAQADNQTNQIVIGYNETGLGSNTTIIGNSSTITTAIRGRLLLGTTTDSGLYQLDVNGTARVSGTLAISGAANQVQNSISSNSTSGLMFWGSGSTNNFTFFDSDGNPILNVLRSNNIFQYATPIRFGASGLVLGSTSTGGPSINYQASEGIILFGQVGGTFSDVSMWERTGTYVACIKNGGSFFIGAAAASHSPSAQLDVVSTTKGFLPPRMTTTQKNAIGTPAAGLMVFDTTLAKLCVYSGTAWETITSI